MRRSLAILTLLVLLFPALVKVGIVAYFQLNRTYIAEALCIRRNEAAPMCSGKCYLGEQLRQVDEQPSSEAPLLLRHKLEAICLLPQQTVDKPLPLQMDGRANLWSGGGYYDSAFLDRVFRPPILFMV